MRARLNRGKPPLEQQGVKMRIVCIGCGNMTRAIVSGLIKNGTAPADILAVDINDHALQRAADDFGITTAPTLDSSVSLADIIVLAVKPQIMLSVCKQLKPHLGTQLVISIAAGLRGSTLSHWLGGFGNIVRVIPNTPALVNHGISAMVALPEAGKDKLSLASMIMGA